jgi:hypothetical protein
MTTKHQDPEWIQEKMFGEEFDSPIIYYVVDIADDFVLYTGTLENCNQVVHENYAGLQVTSYEYLTENMIKSIPEPF